MQQKTRRVNGAIELTAPVISQYRRGNIGIDYVSTFDARQLGMPQVSLIDEGHPAGLRMIECGGFGAPGSPRTAILIECGQRSSFRQGVRWPARDFECGRANRLRPRGDGDRTV